MKKTIYRINAILLISIILSLFAACGQSSSDATGSSQQAQSAQNSSDSPATKTINVWNVDNSPMFEDAVLNIIAEYEKAYPDVNIEYTGLPWDNAKEKLDIAIATNTAPDCVYITQAWAGSLAATGGLLSLNDYVESWDIADEFDMELIYSSGLAIQDELYMMPFETGATICWYRKDWYSDAGISIPATFNDFFTAIEKTTDTAAGRYGFSLRGGSGGSTQLESYLIAYAGAANYFLDNGECFVTDPKTLEGLERFVDIYNVYTAEGDVNNGYAEMVAAFGSDLAAMIYHNNSSFADHVNNLEDVSKFGAFMLPVADNGVRSVGFGPYGYAGWSIFTDSKDYDATWDFVSFACSAEIQGQWNQAVGGLPTNLVAQNADWINEYPALVEMRDVLAAPETKICIIPTFYPDYAAVHMNTITPGLQAVLLGSKTPAEFLDEWNQQMKQAQSDFEASFA